MDLEENIGYRTPFLDEDSKGSKAMFDAISDSYKKPPKKGHKRDIKGT